MPYQQNPSRTPRYGPGRESHARDDSRLATYPTREPIRYHSSVEAVSTSRHRDAGVSRNSYGQNVFDDDSGSDGEAHDYQQSRRGQHTPQEGRQDRHEVHRSWRFPNAEVDRVLDNPALREAIDRLENRVSQNNRSFSRPSRPTPIHRQRSPDQYRANSRPLGYSNLRSLNENRSPQYPMQRRFREDQRSGPYDSIHSVGRRSDYDRHGRHTSYEPNAGYGLQYEEEGYESYEDGRSDNDY